MDRQDTSQLNSDDKISTNLLIHETNSEKETLEGNLSQSEENPEVFQESGTENEVITIVTQENNGEVYFYDRNDIENTHTENPAQFIQICDSSNAFEEVNNTEDKDVNVDGMEEEEVKQGPEEEKGGETPNARGEENQSKNFKNVILEDWDVEVPQVIENHESENCTETPVEHQDVTYSNENCTVVETTDEVEVNQKKKIEQNSDGSLSKEVNSVEEKVRNENSVIGHVENPNPKTPITVHLIEKRLETLKCPKSVTKEEIVKILDDSSERVIKPIVGGKDLFFSIELTKRLNQKLSLGKGKTPEGGEKHNETDPCNNNNTLDDRQKIVDILEADEIKDWKSAPSKSDLGPKENGNDMEISKAIKTMEEIDLKAKTPTKTPRKTPLKKIRTMDKELERTLALQQLREEFPSTRKRSRTSKKVNHVPFLASTVLEKAMTSPEVTTALKPGPPRRRPCYLPENATYSKSKDSIESEESVKENNTDLQEDFDIPGKSIPNPIVKTYSAKRKSTDAESDIKTTLEAVAKALNESSEETNEVKPKKQKTVMKESKNNILIKKKRKLKPGAKNEKKMKSELEKLLGDEGAVRMLYDTQHVDTNAAPPKKTKFKTTTGLKKDLVLKTKLVKNAVMRLSGVGTDGVFLRGRRRSVYQPPATNQEEEEQQPLFSSTPNIVLYKPKKKQRAEASRILYRHSSSESFDSSEGYRRTSIEADVLNPEQTNSVQTEETKPVVSTLEKTPTRGRPKKTGLLKKRLRKMEEARQRKKGKEKGSSEGLSSESSPSGGSKLNLSNVPIRKSCRPRVVSKKYSIWSSTSMDCLSVESLGLKKLKKASTELAKKLNCKELTIMQYEHLVQIILTPTNTILKNSLNLEILQELVHVFDYLSNEDSCSVVLLSSRGNTFCQGVDINRIISLGENERKKEISQLVKAIRDFVICLSTFEKPLIAGVQGAAVGLGVTLLPYCDLIISSDTASFYTPYVKLGQAPEGAPIHTFPIINRQLVSELLYKSLKMMAGDALKHGLVTQVIPEDRFEEDLIMISRNLASQSAQGMQSIKYLLRINEQWDVTKSLQAEGELLEEHWNSSECINNMIKFLNSGELQLKQL